MKPLFKLLLDPFVFLLAHPLVIAASLFVVFTLTGCSPDSYTAEHQIVALPENAGARIAQWPSDFQEFVVVRRDGSVWRYRTKYDAGNSGIRWQTNERGQTLYPDGLKMLDKEDCLLGPAPR